MKDFKKGQIWIAGWEYREDFICVIIEARPDGTFLCNNIENFDRTDSLRYNLEEQDLKKYLGNDLNEAKKNHSIYFI